MWREFKAKPTLHNKNLSQKKRERESDSQTYRKTDRDRKTQRGMNIVTYACYPAFVGRGRQEGQELR